MINVDAGVWKSAGMCVLVCLARVGCNVEVRFMSF
jgi:hypothetical protein